MIAAVYARVSTEDQAKHGYSLPSQLEACRVRALALGAEDVVEYLDEGVSGAVLNRPGLSALREALRQRAIGLVVVLDPDRLARNLSHQLIITEEIETAGARLDFVSFEWKNTPEGQLFYSLRGAIAQYEKEKIRERSVRGALQKAKSGKLPRCIEPYGYDYLVGQGILRINEAQAGVVREIFRLLIDEGLGVDRIHRRLNQLGMLPKKGRPWVRTSVRRIVRNECYTGTLWVHRFDSSDKYLNKHRPKAERLREKERPRAEWIAVPVPAIIDHTTWEDAQAIMGKARRLWAGTSRYHYLLSGLINCGLCHQTMTGIPHRTWGRIVRSYTCKKVVVGGRRGCIPQRFVEADKIEAVVWNHLQALLQNPEEVLWGGEAKGTGAMQAELAETEQALAKCEQAKAGILAVLEAGGLDAKEGTQAMQRVQRRHEELAGRCRELRQAIDRVNVHHAGLMRRRDAAQRFLARMESQLSEEQRKTLLRQLVERVVVQDGKLNISVRWPELFGPETETAAAFDLPDRVSSRQMSAMSVIIRWQPPGSHQVDAPAQVGP